MKILNIRRDLLPPDAVRVDRGTKWGNPFRIGPGAPREVVITAFDVWVRKPAQKERRNAARRELKGKSLACWCSPEPCHAEIWQQIANEPLED